MLKPVENQYGGGCQLDRIILGFDCQFSGLS